MNYRIETSRGVLVGESDGPVSVWRGVRYAAPPVGDLRGVRPQPPERWSGARDATRFGSAAPQEVSSVPGSTPAGIPQSEDCLTLNIWSPGAPTSVRGAGLRPVLVWFHGGSMVHGASSLPDFNGRSLSHNGDIVVVTVNYRLGVLGFGDFTSFDRGRLGWRRSSFDSNLGLRDQVAALEWVNREIAAFGGDPKRVTIMGESSGGTAITTLMTVPSAKGLFRAAIAQSSVVAAVYDRELAATRASRVLELLKIPEKQVTRLREVPAEVLVDVGSRVFTENSLTRPGTLVFGPVVDGSFLPEHPLDAFAAGRAHRVPLLIGTNRDESMLFAFSKAPLLPLTREQNRMLTERIDAATTEHGARGVVARLRDSYGDPSAWRVRHTFAADWAFTMPTLRAADAHSRVAPTFVYRYDYVPPGPRIFGLGAMHGTEIPLIFGNLRAQFGRLLFALGGRRAAKRRSAQMQKQFVAFVRAGDPGWPGYDVAARRTRIFGSRTRDVRHPAADRVAAWIGVRFTE